MKTITLKELPKILDKARNNGTVEKPYSILLVGECGTGVSSTIESWIEKRREQGDSVSKVHPLFYDTSICSSDIVIWDARPIKGSTEKEKAFSFYYDLIHKKRSVDVEKLKLVITQVYTPLWLDNDPLFGTEDYNMFDEVVFVEANIEVFKEYFTKYMDELILFEESDGNVNDAEQLKEIKKIGLFVLNHPKFHFIPIETDGTPDILLGGLNAEYFTPSQFIQITTRYHTLDELLDMLNDNNINITSKGSKKMLLEILSEYKG